MPGKDERTTFAFRVDAFSQNVTIRCYGAQDDATTNPYKSKPPNVDPRGTDNHEESNVRVSVNGKVVAKHTYPSPNEDYYFPVAGVTVIMLRTGSGLPLFAITTTGADGSFYIQWDLGKAKDLSSAPRFTLGVTNYNTDVYTPPPAQAAISLVQGQNNLFRSMDFTLSFELGFQQGRAPDIAELNISPDRQVNLRQIGLFKIQADEEMQAIQEALTQPLPLFEETEHFASGFRERASRQGDALHVGYNGTTTASLLYITPGRFLLAQATISTPDQPTTWAYKDDEAQFFIQKSDPGKYRMLADGHDYTDDVRERLYLEDVEGAMRAGRETAAVPIQGVNANYLDPRPGFKSSTARAIDFDLSLPYASYNWEIFFHIPFLVAIQLGKNMRFEEAEHWFHLIFNPMTDEDGDEAMQYWRFLPFRQAGRGNSIEDLLKLLAKATSGQTLTQEEVDLSNQIRLQIEEWKDHPFQPHAIARSRVRAYQLVVVLKYLENLIAWADQLFRQDTIESINKATQLYIRAARILGNRPVANPSLPKLEAGSYRTLLGKWDELSNAWVSFEALIGLWIKHLQWLKEHGVVGPNGTAEIEEKIKQLIEQLRSLATLYFCVPHNEKLLEYWDTVEDRLFKIRHCMNIEGVERHLPLFEPPIDPALLVQATAAGLDLSTVLADLNAPLPHYRFNIMLQKALELASEVKSMGAALLSALEKKDAEELALLRSKQEIELLKQVTEVREQQIKEAQANLEALRRTRLVIFERYRHYQDCLAGPM